MTATPLVAKTGIGFGDETLSTYDEGTWVPVVTCSGSGTITPSTISGTYVRVGNMVTIQIECGVTSVSSPVGNIRVSLPFTAKTTGHAMAGSAYIYAFSTGISSVTSTVSSAGTTVSIYGIADLGVVFDSANRCKAGSAFTIGITYFT